MSEEFQSKLNEAVKLLIEACHPERIIQFGSYARGTETEDSDLDLMVIENRVQDRAEEMVRLCRILSPLQLGVDLVVADSETFKNWRECPGSVYYEAHTDGKSLYEAA